MKHRGRLNSKFANAGRLPQVVPPGGRFMSRPALKKFFLLFFSVFILVLVSEKRAWAHLAFDVEPYFKYGIPAIILGVIIGCVLGRKIPIVSSIAGGIGGMLLSGIVISIITGDSFGMFVAFISLFFVAIFSGLIFGLVYRFLKKIMMEVETPVQKVAGIDDSKNTEPEV
jgi:hypothetical protein